MNNKACKGLILTKAAMETSIKAFLEGKEDNSQYDPEGLTLSQADSTWDNVDESLADATDEASAVALCRAWYDANAYGKPFCCQMMYMDMSSADLGKSIDASVVNAESITAADPFESEIGDIKIKFEFGALTFQGAQALASGFCLLASIIVLMN